MESNEPLKKDPPVFERSIMLTRFKLSQQKRQLREKDKRLTITQTLKKSPKTSTKKRKQSAIKNKRKLQTNSDKEEFYPNKLKRNKVVKKVVLKPKNELKVISWNGVKRKLQTDDKPPNVKKRKNHKLSTDTNEDKSSPEYSELSFDEVIHMADEHLDDEDLMEILTCPSPVWWEDPPDDKHIEGPIVLKTNTLASMPDLAPEHRRKQARKRTPQKIIIEECKTNNVTDENSLQNTVINIKKADVKFIKKCNKLEDLLSTMKSKKDLKEKDSKDKIEKKDVSEVNEVDEEIKEKTVVSDTSGDSSYLDIPLFDNDILKHLENIKIPIQDIEQEKCIEKKRKFYKHKAIYTKKSKKNNNETLKIDNAPKLPNLRHISSFKIAIPREKPRNCEEKSLKNDKKTLQTENEGKNNDNRTQLTKEEIANSKEEYVTVFEIINSDDDAAKNTDSKISDKKEINENDKHKLNSYYKKCKKSTNKETKITNNINNKGKSEKMCYDCNLDKKSSIVVPSSHFIKYCLKCSSIFDLDFCSYCKGKEENQEKPT